ncbi:PAS domain-containing protein [Phormidesmis priestleyi ULC007]|uniref:histidine kinase n=1 Tax=Phormidesmis priestleyi ULC007 TaxID=1920490 RepID=A0A2T1DKG7_9CYAN|nr:chemotaxis protein CheB [Phormidesmis priestleyi]PSB20924.1 PAS domain-containing protein [Phormidesmis priestleyi ULC007]PZO51879.1 MAG: PAS domain-containing protein [Phormidesmis priestleyi]
MTSNPPSQQPFSNSGDAQAQASQEPFDLMQQSAIEASFPIVGVAASAGGLEAFTQLLSHLPTDTGMAFVLIQHLAPDHESLLREILSRATQLPVHQVENDMKVEPNQVYVIPPNTKMILSQGMLQLSPREKVFGKYMPGDAFFASLAADRGHKAIAVVLSGSDGDGSLGLKAIKAAGGVTFAQCESTARFDSMPNTAVATGNVDFVLPPEKIAEELVNLSRNPMLERPLPLISTEESPQPGDALATIFALLRSTTGVDFSHYKPNTLDRRIHRRMLLCKLEQPEDYAAYLQANPAEITALSEEILIHVTSFFRDPEAFELLKTQVFPTIVRNKSADSPIRIWVAGCSTGEEVYSIAICLLEFLADHATQPPIQIFATDISESAINKARSGIYQENQMVEVSPERRRFFHALEHGGCQITKAVRELCVFARQNLGSDPPFSNLDLISCRNVLIYLSDSLQKRIMPIFHYSLNSTGFLLLGTSESTGQSSELFTLVERKSRIYAKKLTATRSTFSFTPSRYPIARVRESQPIQAPTEGFDLQKKVDQLIANRYAPIGVVIDNQMQVLQLRGDIDRYLKLVSGIANFNLFNLVRDGLLVELRAAIYQAQRQEMPVIKNGLHLKEGEQSRMVNLQVIPFKVPTAEEYRFLVLFEDALLASSLSPVDLESQQGDLEQENARLRQELAAATQEQLATQEYLQAVIQEQEYVTQDLKVANEEILSSNEELQSTNEELETAKEEIQATNEELNTTNEELRSRNSELHQVNNDLTNLLASINIPILMLTHDLRIRRFTPMAQRLFNFIPTDAGRPLSDIRANLNVPDLEPLMLEVLETLNVKELDVQTQGGHWYTLRIRPYRTAQNQIDGVVLVLLDIDALKRSAATLKEARNYAEAIVETVQVPLLVLESDFRVNQANRSFYETFEVEPNETARSLIFDLGNGQWNRPRLRSLLEDIFANNTILQNFEVEHNFERIGQKTMLLNALKMIEAGDTQRILLAIEDITDRKQFEIERSHLLTQEQLARQEAEAANRAKDEFLSNLSHELRNPLNAMLGWAQILRTHKLGEAAVTRALETIERSARAQSQLIEDMLDISRITSGKLHLNSHRVDLVLVVNAAISSIQLSAEAKSIQIVSQLTSAMIVGDVDRLQQVLWNLLSNAVKFTPTDGQVEITLEPVQTHAEIRVSDTGQGIRAEILPYVFDRFRQGDSSTTKGKQGLGLGLSIVRHIVELHGGTVQAESPGEGQGTTVIVRLPLRSMLPETLPSQLEPTAEELNIVSQTVPSLAGLSILAVDDDVDSLDLMKYMLEEEGAEVTVVTSVREAIAALTEAPGRYDVLLADIGMPEEDGFSLIRQVRRLGAEAGGQIPAAAITAYVSDREQQMAIDAGFQTHIGKPIDLAQLVLAIVDLTQ